MGGVIGAGVVVALLVFLLFRHRQGPRLMHNHTSAGDGPDMFVNPFVTSELPASAHPQPAWPNCSKLAQRSHISPSQRPASPAPHAVGSEELENGAATQDVEDVRNGIEEGSPQEEQHLLRQIIGLLQRRSQTRYEPPPEYVA